MLDTIEQSGKRVVGDIIGNALVCFLFIYLLGVLRGGGKFGCVRMWDVKRHFAYLWYTLFFCFGRRFGFGCMH